MDGTAHRTGEVWEIMEGERKRDRLVRRVSGAAWIVTLTIMLVFVVIVGAEVVQTFRMWRLGAAPMTAVTNTLIPLLAVVGTTSLLLALVSTVGVFLRFRTASLGDIQLRLATLETLLSAPSPGDEEGLI